MLSKRLIVCLDVRDRKVTKGVRFQGNVDVGDPISMAASYYRDGVDELVFYDITASQLSATSTTGETLKSDTYLGSNIEKTALENLEARKFRVYAKALGRPVFKYLLEKGLESKVEERHGRGAGNAVKGVGSLYNIFSERADLRSWQTLPAQIRITRLILTPGAYKFSLNNLNEENTAIEAIDFGEMNLKAGETKFIIYRTTR